MKEMSINDAVKLVKVQDSPSISIYLKTDRRERDSLQKARSNLARLYKSVEALIVKTYDFRTKEKLLDPLKKALSRLRLSQEKGGIAIYHNENFTHIVQVPTLSSDLAVAAESFHLKPLLRCVQLRRNYFLLALRKQCADLYLVKPESLEKIERIGFTQTRSDLMLDNEVMRDLDRRLRFRLKGERMPLVIAGNEQYEQVFRKNCTYGYLLAQSLVGDIEYMGEKTIEELASQLIELHYSKIDNHTVEAFRKAEAAGLASSNLIEIAGAAARGQVQNLLIAEDKHIWGHLDRESGAIEVLAEKLEAKSDDLLDDIAELILLKGGKVTVLPSFQMPRGKSIAAIFRWSNSSEGVPMRYLMKEEIRHNTLQNTG